MAKNNDMIVPLVSRLQVNYTAQRHCLQPNSIDRTMMPTTFDDLQDQSPDSLLTESTSPNTPDFKELDDGSVLIPDDQEAETVSSSFGD